MDVTNESSTPGLQPLVSSRFARLLLATPGRRASNRGGLRPANVPYTPTRWSIGNHSIGTVDQRVASP